MPVHDDRRHFEFLVLEAAQAGLSWLTVLRRRDGYRRAFCDFDPERVARFDAPPGRRAAGQDPGIIRNRAKVESTVANARALLALQESRAASTPTSGVSSTASRWSTPGPTPPRSRPQTELSQRLSKDLRARGFRFVGPVICYAHLQAAGLVNDHLTSCFRWPELTGGNAP